MNQTKAFKVYQASAGSGKTYTIVKEFLCLCLKDINSTRNFSRILAITFTNMASSDMKRKIIVALNDILNSDQGQEPKGLEADLLKELGITREDLKENATILFYNILHDYSSFNISTIDSFVQKIARSFSKELHLPSQYNVSTDEEETINHVVEDIGKQIGTANPFITKVIEDFYKRRIDQEKSTNFEGDLTNFTKDLLKESAYQKNEQNEFTGLDAYNESIEFVKEKVDGFEERSKVFVKDFEAFCKKYHLSESDFFYGKKSPCVSLYKNVKSKSYQLMKSRQLQIISGEINWYSKTFPQNPSFEDADLEFKTKILPYFEFYHEGYASFDFYKTQRNSLYIYALRSIIRNDINQYIDEEQVVHLSEFNKRINEIMGDFSVPFIYERIGERYRHLFIDEFQDTSILQWQNLLPLIDNNLSDKSLNMVVGDGKQSIYRWRSGEIGQIVNLPRIYAKPDDSPAFDEFENTLIDNFNFNELQSNYRSFRNIVEFNNDFFSCCSKLLSDSCQRVYVDQNEEFQKTVSIHQKVQKEQDGFVQVELFNNPNTATTDIITTLPIIINDLLAKGFQYNDIAILTRKNKEGVMIAKYLSSMGYPIQSLESMLLKNSNRVQLLVNTLDYLIHDTNEIAIANVLFYWKATHQTPDSWILQGLFNNVKDIAARKLSIETQLDMEPGLLNSILSHSYSLYDLCSSLMREYNFNSINDPYLNFFLDMVHRWQSNNKSSIQSFLNYWEQKKDKLSIQAESDNAVRIMTIHKSKGLEFNVVLFPFANNNLMDTKSIKQWLTPEELGFEPIPHVNKVLYTFSDKNLSTPQIEALYKEEANRVMLDNMNLLYVAFTRPKQRLYILTSQNTSKDKISAIDTYLTSQREALCKDLSSNEHVVFQYGDPDSQKVDDGESLIRPVQTAHDSHACNWFNKIEIDPTPSMFWVHPDDPMSPLEWGTFIHQILSEIQTEADIDKAMKPYLDQGIIDAATAEQIRKTFLDITHHPLISKAFAPNAHVKNECEILSKDHFIRRPDRFAEVDGTIYILDYKTGKEKPEHHSQLRQYASLLREMTEQPIECYLVYLNDSLNIVTVNLN